MISFILYTFILTEIQIHFVSNTPSKVSIGSFMLNERSRYKLIKYKPSITTFFIIKSCKRYFSRSIIG